MSAPSGSTGRRTALEWLRQEHTFGGLGGPPETDVWWEASGMPYSMIVEGSEGEARWSVENLTDGAKREGVDFTVETAQLSAETAARDLLCSALAAFSDGAPDGFRAQQWAARVKGREVYLATPDTGDLGRACSMSYADARRLALALLKAAEEP